MKRRLIWTAATTLCLLTTQSAPCQAGGNVLAYLGPDPFGGNTVLTIEGDHLGNEIRIIEIEDAPDHVWIEGLNGTTVNGQAVDQVVASAHFSGALIDLGNGDDAVEYIFAVEQCSSSHFSEITTGNGNDQVSVLASGDVGFLRIDTGTGSDSATLQFASDALVGGVQLNTGPGDDAVFYEADNGEPPIVTWGSAYIDTHSGNDLVSFGGPVWALFEHTLVLLGCGDDVLIGDPDSEVHIPGPSRVDAVGGAGSDTVLNASYFGPHMTFQEFETVVE